MSALVSTLHLIVAIILVPAVFVFTRKKPYMQSQTIYINCMMAEYANIIYILYIFDNNAQTHKHNLPIANKSISMHCVPYLRRILSQLSASHTRARVQHLMQTRHATHTRTHKNVIFFRCLLFYFTSLFPFISFLFLFFSVKYIN